MIKNLNDISKSSIDLKYNNTKDNSLSFSDELNLVIQFTKNDLNSEKKYIVENRLIKNCIIKCPNGEIWNNLDYYNHEKENDTDIDKTVFDFKFVDDWQDGYYEIYVGSNDRGITIDNSESSLGESLLSKNDNYYRIKKIYGTNGITVLSDNEKIILEFNESIIEEQHNLDLNSVVDCLQGSTQVYYTTNDSQITNIINGTAVAVLLYKPNETTVKYSDNIILNKYDIGWYTFVIKKIFDKLFIGEPSKIITDYTISI